MSERLMEVVVGGRGSGKTTAMIDWLREHEYGVLYVTTETEAARLREQYDPDGTLGMAARIVPAHQGALRGSVYRPEVAIDNVDMVLRQLFGDVQVVTMRGADVE